MEKYDMEEYDIEVSVDGFASNTGIYSISKDLKALTDYIKKGLIDNPNTVLAELSIGIIGTPKGLEKYYNFLENSLDNIVDAIVTYQYDQIRNPLNFIATLDRIYKLASTNPKAYLAFVTFAYDNSYWSKLDDCIANFEYNNFKIARIGELQIPNDDTEGYTLIENKDNGLAVLTNGIML